MATWVEFLTEVRDKTEATKQDSGWVANPASPNPMVYIAYMSGQTLGAVIDREERENGYVSYILVLLSPSARTMKLYFSTLADAKLAHKMMTDEEKRYATWEAQNPPKSVDLGTVTIRSLEDLKTLINRIATITNPAPNLQNTPKLFTGDPPKDKN
jgi:hypothetical protein